MKNDNSQQHLNSYQTDNLENEQIPTQNIHHAAGDSKHRLKNKFLTGIEDEISRLLFGESINLLDDILNHPLSIDYFNVYLSLPIFGQRVFYHRVTHQFDFDPPLLSKHQTCEQIYTKAKEWLIKYRLNNYIHTDIYIESLLGLLLTKIEDKIESSSNLHGFIGSKETVTEEQASIFSTVIDVRQFYQFLQSTSGIKYWNFFIDSMRLLQFRRSSRSNRIDISYLNFIFKYYSQQHEFRSITIDLDHPRMPDSSTSDTIWFQMAINAINQLRVYWLPRYLGQISLPFRSKIKHSIIESNPNKKSSSENIIETSSNHLSNTDSIIKESKLVKFTLDNISYLDYNPRQYILIQPSEQDTEELNESDINNNTNQIDKDSKIEFEMTSSLSSDRSIEDYATDVNLELFYRILISDSLAGSPFFEHISQTIPRPDVIPYQTCIRFIIDTEILLSITSGKFKERILRQFISRYLEITGVEKLPEQIFDTIEEQRIDLIEELTTKDNHQYSLLWKILLKITKFLIPHFLNYIKFDRLRFLLQSKILNPNLLIDDLRHRLPLVNFETLLIDRQHTKETNLNETEFISRTNLINCGGQQIDLLNSLIKNQYNTTEKLINTDEQCEFRQGERFPPLTDNELEQELRQFCTKFEWKDIKTVLGKSFDVTLQPTDNTTFSNENSKLNSIEQFTFDIMNSAREIFEIDRFISNLMDESLHIFQTTSSLDSIKSDLNSSPLSPLFEEILLTDSSPTTTTSPNLIINNNALESSDFKINLSEKFDRPIETKILSLIGSYFINSPSLTKTIDNHLNKSSSMNIKYLYKRENFFHESIKFAQKDASNEVKNIFIDKPISSFQNNDDYQQQQQKLIKFIRNQINNHQWPLQEYIGFQGQRAWRALKLAADISNLDNEFMLNYHNDLDWMSTDDNFGSFNERTYLIQRNFDQRIQQQKRSINKF